MFVVFGDLGSDMYVAKQWDEPDFMYICIYMYFLFSLPLGIKEYLKNKIKVEN